MVERIVGSDPPFMLSDHGQLMRSAPNVSRCPNVWYGSSQRLIGHDPVVKSNTQLLKTQILGSRLLASGEHDRAVTIECEALARAFCGYMLGGRTRFDRADLGRYSNVNSEMTSMFENGRTDFLVHSPKDVICDLDQGDRRAQSAKKIGKLERDYATADNEQVRRRILATKNLDVCQGTINSGNGQPGWSRASGDQNMICGETPITYTNGMSVDERRRSANESSTTGPHLLRLRLAAVLYDVVSALDSLRPIHFRRADFNSEFRKTPA